MSVLERRVEEKFTEWLRKNKIKMKKKAPGELLDRWLLLPTGHLFIVELKRPGAKVAPKTGRRQWREILEMRGLGYDVEVHDSAEEAIEAVRIRLEAARLSKKGDQVHAGKLLRRSILRSRAREDKYYARFIEDIKKRRNVRKGTDHSTP